jgi:hypothetical protein
MPFPGKKALSHQISNAIKKKWNKECVNILEEVINENTVNGFDNTTENGSAHNISAMSFSRIK